MNATCLLIIESSAIKNRLEQDGRLRSAELGVAATTIRSRARGGVLEPVAIQVTSLPQILNILSIYFFKSVSFDLRKNK